MTIIQNDTLDVLTSMPLGSRVVICENPRCEWYLKQRFNLPRPIGQGLVTFDAAMCECSPDREMRMVRTNTQMREIMSHHQAERSEIGT